MWYYFVAVTDSYNQKNINLGVGDRWYWLHTASWDPGDAPPRPVPDPFFLPFAIDTNSVGGAVVPRVFFASSGEGSLVSLTILTAFFLPPGAVPLTVTLSSSVPPVVPVAITSVGVLVSPGVPVTVALPSNTYPELEAVSVSITGLGVYAGVPGSIDVTSEWNQPVC